MPSRDAYFFAASHALDVLALADSLGFDAARLCDGLAVTAETLSEPDARVSLADLQALIARLELLSGQPSLGVEIGLRMRAPVHGFLGFAIMASATLREGFQLIARYTPTRTNVLHVELAIDEHEAVLYIDELTDLGRARDTVITAVAVSGWKIAQSMTHTLFEARCELAFPSATGVRRANVRELSLHYEQPRNCLRFAAPLLQLAVPTAHSSGYRLALAQCERALEALATERIATRVRTALRRTDRCGIDDVARALGTSTSTLKRKLKSEGTSFSQLLEAEHCQRACALLRGERLSVEQVAERVGYGDVSNFGRAFRRWMGMTPAAYRRAQAAGLSSTD
jgi:AraC-like DNA-binding protein